MLSKTTLPPAVSETVPFPVLAGLFNKQIQLLVSARDLHACLGEAKEFPFWFGKSVRKYGLLPGEDYGPIPANATANTRIDYFLTLEIAKALAMVANTERGRMARRYLNTFERHLCEPLEFNWYGRKVYPTDFLAQRRKLETILMMGLMTPEELRSAN